MESITSWYPLQGKFIKFETDFSLVCGNSRESSGADRIQEEDYIQR